MSFSFENPDRSEAPAAPAGVPVIRRPAQVPRFAYPIAQPVASRTAVRVASATGAHPALPSEATASDHFQPVPLALTGSGAGHDGNARRALTPHDHETLARAAWKSALGDGPRQDEASDVARLTYALDKYPEKYDQIVQSVREKTREALRPQPGKARPTPDEVASALRRHRKSITEIMVITRKTDERCAQAVERAHDELFGKDDEPENAPTSDGRTSLYYNTSSKHRRIA